MVKAHGSMDTDLILYNRVVCVRIFVLNTYNNQQYDYLHKPNGESFAEPLITENVFTVSQELQ